jgi:hypothetical protein
MAFGEITIKVGSKVNVKELEKLVQVFNKVDEGMRKFVKSGKELKGVSEATNKINNVANSINNLTNAVIKFGNMQKTLKDQGTSFHKLLKSMATGVDAYQKELDDTAKSQKEVAKQTNKATDAMKKQNRVAKTSGTGTRSHAETAKRLRGQMAFGGAFATMSRSKYGRAVRRTMGPVAGEFMDASKTFMKYGLTYGAYRASGEAIRSRVAGERTSTQAASIAGLSEAEAKKLKDIVKGVAFETRESYENVANLAKGLIQAGIGVNALKEGGEGFRNALFGIQKNMKASFGDLSSEQAVRSFSAIFNAIPDQMRKSWSETDRLGFAMNKLNQTAILANKSVLGIGQAVAVFPKLSIATILGIENTDTMEGVKAIEKAFGELQAIYLTTVKKTGRSAGEIETTFKTLISRLRSPKMIESLKNLYGDMGFEKFGELGPKLAELDKMKSPLETLKLLGQTTQFLDDSAIGKVADTLGKIRQGLKVDVALRSVIEAQELYNEAMKDGDAVTRNYKTALQEWGSVFTHIKNTMSDILRIDFFSNLAKQLARAASGGGSGSRVSSFLTRMGGMAAGGAIVGGAPGAAVGSLLSLLPEVSDAFKEAKDLTVDLSKDGLGPLKTMAGQLTTTFGKLKETSASWWAQYNKWQTNELFQGLKAGGLTRATGSLSDRTARRLNDPILRNLPRVKADASPSEYLDLSTGKYRSTGVAQFLSPDIRKMMGGLLGSGGEATTEEKKKVSVKETTKQKKEQAEITADLLDLAIREEEILAAQGKNTIPAIVRQVKSLKALLSQFQKDEKDLLGRDLKKEKGSKIYTTVLTAKKKELDLTFKIARAEKKIADLKDRKIKKDERAAKNKKKEDERALKEKQKLEDALFRKLASSNYKTRGVTDQLISSFFGAGGAIPNLMPSSAMMMAGTSFGRQDALGDILFGGADQAKDQVETHADWVEKVERVNDAELKAREKLVSGLSGFINDLLSGKSLASISAGGARSGLSGLLGTMIGKSGAAGIQNIFKNPFDVKANSKMFSKGPLGGIGDMLGIGGAAFGAYNLYKSFSADRGLNKQAQSDLIGQLTSTGAGITSKSQSLSRRFSMLGQYNPFLFGGGIPGVYGNKTGTNFLGGGSRGVGGQAAFYKAADFQENQNIAMEAYLQNVLAVRDASDRATMATTAFGAKYEEVMNRGLINELSALNKDIEKFALKNKDLQTKDFKEAFEQEFGGRVEEIQFKQSERVRAQQEVNAQRERELELMNERIRVARTELQQQAAIGRARQRSGFALTAAGIDQNTALGMAQFTSMELRGQRAVTSEYSKDLEGLRRRLKTETDPATRLMLEQWVKQSERDYEEQVHQTNLMEASAGSNALAEIAERFAAELAIATAGPQSAARNAQFQMSKYQISQQGKDSLQAMGDKNFWLQAIYNEATLSQTRSLIHDEINARQALVGVYEAQLMRAGTDQQVAELQSNIEAERLAISQKQKDLQMAEVDAHQRRLRDLQMSADVEASETSLAQARLTLAKRRGELGMEGGSTGSIASAMLSVRSGLTTEINAVKNQLSVFNGASFLSPQQQIEQNQLQAKVAQLQLQKLNIDQEVQAFNQGGNTSGQLFEVGSTSTVNLTQNFIVQAGAFLGNPAEARMFAEFVRDEIDKLGVGVA